MIDPSPQVALLIDADGMSLEVIRGALDLKTAQHGSIHIKRCYCSADFAVKNLEFLKERGIRPMVNATSGKNCTDIALAIDAVELCGRDRPGVVVVVASDSDFAPLVMHLRERGCRVEGVGQHGKTGAETPRAYDEFIDLPQARRASVPRAPARGAAKAAERRPASRAAARPAPVPALPPDIAAWLEAVPNLESGQKVELNAAAEALRKAKLLAKSASSTRLFRRYPEYFDLLPARQPNSVQYFRNGKDVAE
jgi:uncharacterized protein (TIGR00288 family)